MPMSKASWTAWMATLSSMACGRARGAGFRMGSEAGVRVARGWHEVLLSARGSSSVETTAYLKDAPKRRRAEAQHRNLDAGAAQHPLRHLRLRRSHVCGTASGRDSSSAQADAQFGIIVCVERTHIAQMLLRGHPAAINITRSAATVPALQRGSPRCCPISARKS